LKEEQSVGETPNMTQDVRDNTK